MRALASPLFKERQHVSTLQLTAHHHLTDGIRPVNLKNRLRDIQSIVVIVCMDSSSRSSEP
jgi:hypothetical protein